MAKVIAVLYPDPVDGYPKKYARDDIPKITKYPDGQPAPTPSAIDFKPGELLGSVSGELGLRKFLEKAGHTLVVTSSKDGKDSVLDKELPDAEIVISQPFWPAYMTKERIDKAKKLKLIITAGIGSDHTDLQAAMDKGITVAEVTFSNSISVAEHVVMAARCRRRRATPLARARSWNPTSRANRSAPNISSWTRASWLEPVLIPTPRAMPQRLRSSGGCHITLLYNETLRLFYTLRVDARSLATPNRLFPE